jgi:hypothetical protein
MAIEYGAKNLTGMGMFRLIAAGWNTYDGVLIVVLAGLPIAIRLLRMHKEVLAYAYVAVGFIIIGGTNLGFFGFYASPSIALLLTAILSEYSEQKWLSASLLMVMVLTRLWNGRAFVVGYPLPPILRNLACATKPR